MALYDAFISYSHANDKPVATALQRAVQTLGKPWYQRRALRVFRDDTSLSATPQLWPTIEQALAESRYLILLASPEAAASRWVGKEIAWWLERKSADTLLIAVTDGTLTWDNATHDFTPSETTPLPPALKGRFAAEPKWVDLTAYREGADKRDAKFTELAADFAAAIRGMPKEDLLSQEVKQQRRALTLAWSAACALLLFAGAALWQWQATVEQRNRAVAAERDATEQKGEAQSQRDLAVRNFGIAKEAADRVVFRIAQDLRNVQGMPSESVRRILGAAQAMIDELARTAPDDPQLQRSRSAMFGEFVETYASVGDLPRARAAADEALGIDRRLAAADPGSEEGQRSLGVSLIRACERRREASDRTEALAACEESLAIWRKLAAIDPNNTQLQRGVYAGLIALGDTRLRPGDQVGAVAALAAYQEGLAIARRLAAAESRNTQLQRDVSLSLDRIGEARQAAGQRAEALAAYEESLAIARKLAAVDPLNAMWQIDVSGGLDHVGELRFDAGDRAGALASHEGSLTIRSKLAASDPGNVQWQNELGTSLNKVGDMRSLAGDRVGALAVYEESVAIRRKLAAADPSNARWKRELNWSLERVGGERAARGDRAGALVAYKECLDVMRKLAAVDPGNEEAQRDVSTTLDSIGDLQLATGDRVAALAAYEESLAIRRKVAAVDPGNSGWQADVAAGLYKASFASDPLRAQAMLREGVALAEALERDGKLSPDQQDLPQRLREALARLPPDTAETR